MSDIMVHYEKLVTFLGDCLGDGYEVTLSVLEPGKNRVAAASGGRSSGRRAGSEIARHVLEIANSGSWRFKDCDCARLCKSDDNRPLLCSYYYIKDGVELLGILCVSADLEKYRRMALDILELGNIPLASLTPTAACAPPAAGRELIQNQAQEVIDSVMGEILGAIPSNRLTKDERIELIRRLHEKGVFMMKGAVPDVAKKLGCSEATIYRYLSNVEK